MASGRHPDSNSAMFFGYSIDEDSTFLQNAPEPPPGDPLLSATEHNELNSWFDNMTADDRPQNFILGNAVHSENWIELPQLIGSATSFGQPQNSHHAPLGDHVFSQDFFSNMPLMFSSAPGPMPPSQTLPLSMPPNMTPGMPPGMPPSMPPSIHSNMLPNMAQGMVSVPRSNSTPAIGLQMGAGMRHSPPVGNGAGLGIGQSPPDDMVAAANTLLLNGHHGTRHSSFNYGPRLHTSQQQHGISGIDMTPGPSHAIVPDAPSPSAFLPSSSGQKMRTAHLSSSTASAHMGANPGTLQPSGLVYINDRNTAQQMPQPLAMPAAGVSVHRQGLQWGTDQSFSEKQFTPQSAKETSEALMSVHLKSMECLEPNHSTGTTRPSSPSYNQEIVPLNLKTRTSSFFGEIEAGGNTEMAPPRKRRKGKGARGDDNDKTVGEGLVSGAGMMTGDGDVDGDGLATNAKTRKRKAKTASNGQPPSQDKGDSDPNATDLAVANGTSTEAVDAGTAPTKRRRSAAATKLPRENLTEEQKRENHIKSEQKRRTLIKTGFADLCVLVPGLQGGNLSKSLVLTTAAGWLTDLLEGNKRLQNQLSAMNGTAFAA